LQSKQQQGRRTAAPLVRYCSFAVFL